MKLNKKKNFEFLIVNTIYNKSEYKYNEKNGESQEKPDFILKKNNRIEFGVEVTELYFDETSARLKKRKKYIEDIKKGEVDKRDIKPLHLTSVYLDIGNDNESDYQFLFNDFTIPQHTEKDYKSAIIKRLEEKRNKSKEYEKNLSYIELIIYDTESFFYNYSEEETIDFLNRNSDILKLIEQTIFKNVYIMTIINKKPNTIKIKNKKFKLNF